MRPSTAPAKALFCVYLISIDSWKKVWEVISQDALAKSLRSMATSTYTDLIPEGGRKAYVAWVVALPVVLRSSVFPAIGRCLGTCN